MIGPKAYIHSERLKNNLWKIRRYVGPRNLMIVVKANGYGHGAINIASIIRDEPNIIFCVFTIEEAIELRDNGVKNNILVFSKIQREILDRVIKYNLWVNASDQEDLKMIHENYQRTGKSPNIHLKFDTGMTRLGFELEDAGTVFEFLKKHSHLKIQGLYSHFATADEGDLTYAHAQLSKFNKIIALSRDAGIQFKYIHCSNSGAVLNLPDAFFNTIRVGMLLYGSAPSRDVLMNIEVEPVMSFCGPIINVRKVKPGTQVSYGGVYTTNQTSNIAVIQTGFADGFPRPWYEKGYVSYKGSHYKIAGRVCMDQLMVDFKDVEPKIGDEVLFFGKKENDFISIETIAEEIDTTTYVLLTAIHGRTEYVLI